MKNFNRYRTYSKKNPCSFETIHTKFMIIEINNN